LPDGLFLNQKFKVGKILEGLGKENVGTFYAHLECITAIQYILWTFGNLVVCKFGIFSPVLVYCIKKNLATLLFSRETKYFLAQQLKTSMVATGAE
jgi:hypothetical protein